MSLKSLAKAVIMQSAKDIMDKHLQEKAISFFCGEGFIICAHLAGMDNTDQRAILNLLRHYVNVQTISAG
jgi:hypothetical protein